MNVKVAETAGFCFGVQRAVDRVYDLIGSDATPIYTLGPIIHNEEVVSDLEKKGVAVICEEDLGSLKGGTVVIRSHGVGRKVYNTIKKYGLGYVDVTCPFVLKIHKIVERESARGAHIVIIGDPDQWPEEYQKYFFTPVNDGSEFDWQYEQHANVVLPDGDVMCFDNGHFRSKDPAKRIKNKDNFSRGVRYHINTDDMTIRQVWQYGKERGQEFFSQYICNVEFYGEGHYMVHSGGIQYYGEDASEEFAAMMKDDPMVRTRSITVELLDDVKMLELEVEGNFYRAEKLSLYHDKENMPLGDGLRLGHMGVTKEFDTLIPMDPCGEEIPHIYETFVEEEDDRFTFRATFESGQLVMLMLEQGEEQHGYYISTAKTKFAALCCGTFIEKDARKVSISVNKAGLKGTYDLRVIVDDKKYDTGIKIEC